MEGLQMEQNNKSADNFLISDYAYFQKAFELWANHFMGVFYLWAGVIVVPASAATLLPQLGVAGTDQKWILGVVFIGIAFIGAFISLKMFDIRKAQLNYIEAMNRIRGKAYTTLCIKDRYDLDPYGENFDRANVWKNDFGNVMAIVMSLIQGIYIAIGIHAALVCVAGISFLWSIGCGFVLFCLNYWGYHHILKPKEPKKNVKEMGAAETGTA